MCNVGPHYSGKTPVSTKLSAWQIISFLVGHHSWPRVSAAHHSLHTLVVSPPTCSDYSAEQSGMLCRSLELSLCSGLTFLVFCSENLNCLHFPSLSPVRFWVPPWLCLIAPLPAQTLYGQLVRVIAVLTPFAFHLPGISILAASCLVS